MVSDSSNNEPGGYFLDFDSKREAAARYGLTVDDVQDVVQAAIGGMNVTETIEGRERYPVQVRYARDIVAEKLDLAPATRLDWAGQFRYFERAKEKLGIVGGLDAVELVSGFSGWEDGLMLVVGDVFDLGTVFGLLNGEGVDKDGLIGDGGRLALQFGELSGG